jgi:hypothetical protein
VLFLIKLSSCTISTTRLDNTEDKSKAEKITREFYDRLIADNYKQTLFYYSEKFKKNIDTNQLFSFYRHYKDVTGTIKNVQIVKCNTKAIDNAGIRTSYFTITYQVTRSIKSTKEVFVLKAVGHENPKIYRYDIIENGGG